jgi:hypothetical protein
LAFTVKCAWNVTKALDPSDPCYGSKMISVGLDEPSPFLTARMFSESLFQKFAV